MSWLQRLALLGIILLTGTSGVMSGMYLNWAGVASPGVSILLGFIPVAIVAVFAIELIFQRPRR
jgi:hypothetical protein